MTVSSANSASMFMQNYICVGVLIVISTLAC